MVQLLASLLLLSSTLLLFHCPAPSPYHCHPATAAVILPALHHPYPCFAVVIACPRISTQPAHSSSGEC